MLYSETTNSVNIDQSGHFLLYLKLTGDIAGDFYKCSAECPDIGVTHHFRDFF